MKTLAKTFAVVLALLVGLSPSFAQRSELSLTINEQFFDALIDATFKNYDPPEFSIASNDAADYSDDGMFGFLSSDRLIFGPSAESVLSGCGTLKVLRETGGMRTSVRFREGKIYVPLAFSGTYAPPFIGCVDFSGWAESVVDLEFDQTNQRLVGRVRVTNVNLNGTGGLGGSMIAKMIQGSVDKKFNPVEIITLDKVSFGLPIPNTGKLNMHATGVRPEVVAGALVVHIDYEFLKG